MSQTPGPMPCAKPAAAADQILDEFGQAGD